MKKVIILFCALSVILFAFTSSKLKYQEEYGLGVVNKVEGKYVFFYARPYHEHDTVFQFTTLVATNNADKGVKAAMKKATKVAIERGVEFDAIITGQAQYDYAIKFR